MTVNAALNQGLQRLGEPWLRRVVDGGVVEAEGQRRVEMDHYPPVLGDWPLHDAAAAQLAGAVDVLTSFARVCPAR